MPVFSLFVPAVRLIACRYGFLCFTLIAIALHPVHGQEPDYLRNEMPELPKPEWVEMHEVDSELPALQGMRVPQGINVELVAQEPLLVDPVGMSFADDGALYVLEWRAATEQIDTTYEVHYQDGTVATVNRKTKNAHDHLKRVVDRNEDGIFDHAELVMDDLEMPSSVLLHNNWFYLPSVGHVIRRRRDPDNPMAWTEQEILRGMCGYHHHQVSGLTLSHDNWMYTTTGDDDNIAEGSDGSRATVLRTGAIFRSRPDGSQLSEFARGFRNPYRNVVFDEHYNMFHVDNDQEDGSKFQGVRLMHLLEGADYGWRLEMGAKCCRTDFARGAVFGERPGKMPSMLKTGRGAPAGLLIYQGTAFPDFFRGLLIYPDVYRMKVRAYEIERDGSTFKVVRQFVLMESDNGMFRPVQALAGPDGAIYVLDWATNSGGAGRSWGDTQHGRLYRLTWSGHGDTPARSRGSLQAWSTIANKSDEALFEMLVTTRKFDVRERVQRELVRRGERHRAQFLKIAGDAKHTLPARASAIGAACQLYDADVHQTLRNLCQAKSFEVRRLAADGISHHLVVEYANEELADELLELAARDPHPAVRRSAALAAGQLASVTNDAHVTHTVVDQLWEELQTTLSNNPSASEQFLYDGFVRGFERCGKAAMDRLVAALTDEKEEQRELATQLFPALRTRAAAEALDRALASNPSLLNESQMARLLETHRHILVHPPIEATGVQRWLQANPQAPASLQLTALQTLALVGGGDSPVVTELALRLLKSDNDVIRQGVIDACGELRVIKAAPLLYASLWDSNRTLAERQSIVQTLSRLKAEAWPYSDRGEPGVERVLPDLIKRIDDVAPPELAADALWLVGEIDFSEAEALALKRLDAKDINIVNAAIELLGRVPKHAKAIGKMFVDQQLPAESRVNVVDSLQRHLTADPEGQIAELLNAIFKDGLTVSLEPEQLATTKQLVLDQGDPKRGRTLFLDAQKTQCINCHRIEGVGGVIGPDLNRVWQTHTIEKLIESIVDPSREIKEGYESWTVTTHDGQVYGGLKISEGPPRFIVRTATGRDHRIPLNEIEEKVASKRSLMPEQIVAQLSLQEFLDLIAFLKDEQTQRELRQSE